MVQCITLVQCITHGAVYNAEWFIFDLYSEQGVWYETHPQWMGGGRGYGLYSAKALIEPV